MEFEKAGYLTDLFLQVIKAMKKPLSFEKGLLLSGRTIFFNQFQALDFFKGSS